MVTKNKFFTFPARLTPPPWLPVNIDKENKKERKAKMIGDSRDKFQPITKSLINYDLLMDSVREHTLVDRDYANSSQLCS